jgi:hypothetical protein
MALGLFGSQHMVKLAGFDWRMIAAATPLHQPLSRALLSQFSLISAYALPIHCAAATFPITLMKQLLCGANEVAGHDDRPLSASIMGGSQAPELIDLCSM